MYLGVDGGGTKTAFALVDATGELVAEHEESGSYYLEVGLDGVKTLIETGARRVLAKANCAAEDVGFAFFGLPAYGEDSNLLSTLDELPLGIFPTGNYRCDNDMVCGWAGSLACQDGINVVAGTGSIGFGQYQGASARCGGWGEVFGDEGSAYWIAQRGLQLFSRMSDGRSHRGPLYEMVRSEYALAQDLDMSTLVIHSWASDRSRIAAFSQLVEAAAREGDLDAAGVFIDAAGELLDIVKAIHRQLRFAHGVEVPVSFSGGVLNAGSLIMESISRGLLDGPVKYSLVKPAFSPVIGAALYAGVLGECEAIVTRLKNFSLEKETV